jgi:hypothetical protein
MELHYKFLQELVSRSRISIVRVWKDLEQHFWRELRRRIWRGKEFWTKKVTALLTRLKERE